MAHQQESSALALTSLSLAGLVWLLSLHALNVQKQRALLQIIASLERRLQALEWTYLGLAKPQLTEKQKR